MKKREMRMAALLLASGLSGIVQAGYTLTTLDGLQSANDINNFGQIAGMSTSSSGGEYHAVIWDGGTVTDLGSGEAYAINDSGVVVGARYIKGATGLDAWHATQWNGTTTTELTALGERDSYAKAINNSGQAAGWSVTSSAYTTHAVAWNGTSPTDLAPFPDKRSSANAINDSGQIAGYSSSYDGGQQAATVWTSGVQARLPFLLGGNESLAYAINNSGQVVGYSNTRTTAGLYEVHATAWVNFSPIDLGTLPGGTWSFALSNNNLGQIVGWSYTDNSMSDMSKHATLWKDGTVTDLNSLLDSTLVSAGWVMTSATGINDNGWIVGYATNTLTGQAHSVLLTPVPEPEAYLMVLAGLGLVGFVARRRRQVEG